MGLPAVRHLPTGVDLRAVFGGRFAMGMSPEEEAELAAALARLGQDADDRDELLGSARRIAHRARPVHPVTVAPFLAASEPIAAARLAADGSPAAVEKRLAALTWRLLTEAEWEYLARDAGDPDRRWLLDLPAAGPVDLSGAGAPAAVGERVSALGLRLGRAAGLADAWHETYDGAPADGTAWKPAKARGGGVRRGPRAAFLHRTEGSTLQVAVREAGEAEPWVAISLVLADRS